MLVVGPSSIANSPPVMPNLPRLRLYVCGFWSINWDISSGTCYIHKPFVPPARLHPKKNWFVRVGMCTI